ncbi:hypothetical protein ACLOJK_002779 [Asimina triloba]
MGTDRRETTDHVYNKFSQTLIKHDSSLEAMAKEMDSPSMPLGLFGVLRESVNLPLRNRSLFLSIALFLLIPTSLFFLFNDFAIKPLIVSTVVSSYKMQASSPQSPGFKKLADGITRNIGILISEEVLYVLLCSFISLAATIATVHASAMAYHGKDLTGKGLLVRIKQIWKQPVMTWLLVSLFNLGIFVLVLALMGFVVLTMKSFTSLAFVVVLVTILLLRFYVYMAVVWKLGIVASVLEDGSYGMGAIAKATELIRGRRRQGYVIYLLFKLPPLMILWLLSSAMRDRHRSHASRLVIGLVVVFSSCLEQILTYIAFTVLYSDCKKSQGEKLELEGESGYSLVPSTTHVDAYVP